MTNCQRCHKDLLISPLDGARLKTKYCYGCRLIVDREKKRAEYVHKMIQPEHFLTDDEWFKSERYIKLRDNAKKYNPMGVK